MNGEPQYSPYTGIGGYTYPLLSTHDLGGTSSGFLGSLWDTLKSVGKTAFETAKEIYLKDRTLEAPVDRYAYPFQIPDIPPDPKDRLDQVLYTPYSRADTSTVPAPVITPGGISPSLLIIGGLALFMFMRKRS